MFGLRSDPFRSQAVLDESDFRSELMVLTKLHRMLISGFRWGFAPDDPFRIILLGERGIGKTTSLFFLKQHIQQNAQVPVKLCYLCRSYFQVSQDLPSLVGAQVSDLDKFLESSKQIFYWLIDFPDRYSHEGLQNLLIFLERVIHHPNLSIFLAMNKLDYDGTFRISSVLGKFHCISIPGLELDEASQLIAKRLSHYRDPSYAPSWELEPFTQDCIPLILQKSSGIPRNMLCICSELLNSALDAGVDRIDLEYCSKLLEGMGYIDRILMERVDDPTLLKLLKLLIQEIKHAFRGFVPSELELANYMAAKHNWSRDATRKRLQRLVQLRILDLSRSERDLWTKQYKLI